MPPIEFCLRIAAPIVIPTTIDNMQTSQQSTNKNKRGSSTESAQAKKKVSRQEISAAANDLKGKKEFCHQIDHLFRQMRQMPQIYHRSMMKPVREFCEYRDNHLSLYQGIPGEPVPLHPNHRGEVQLDLSQGYISGIANYNPAPAVANLVLQVVSSETTF